MIKPFGNNINIVPDIVHPFPAKSPYVKPITKDKTGETAAIRVTPQTIYFLFLIYFRLVLNHSGTLNNLVSQEYFKIFF